MAVSDLVAARRVIGALDAVGFTFVIRVNRACRRSGPALFGTSQPRKARIQHGDAFCHGDADGGKRTPERLRHGGKSAPADSLVSTERSAAAGSEQADLLEWFVKQGVGVRVHGVFPDTTFISSGANDKQAENRPITTGRWTLGAALESKPGNLP
jgi:hypothetical protein